MGLLFGCAITNIDAIQMLMPLIVFPNLVYSGFLSNYDSIPIPFRYITYISPFRYSFSSMILNKFTGNTLDCENDAVHPCDPISDLNITLSLREIMVILACIAVAARVVAALCLKALVKRLNT